MPFSRDAKLCIAKIDADAIRRFQRRQRITEAASDFKNPASWRNEKTQVTFIFAMEKSRFCSPASAHGRELIGVLKDRRLSPRKADSTGSIRMSILPLLLLWS